MTAELPPLPTELPPFRSVLCQSSLPQTLPYHFIIKVSQPMQADLMDEQIPSPIHHNPQDGSFSDLGDPEPAVCEDTQTVLIEEDQQEDSTGPMLRTPAQHHPTPPQPHPAPPPSQPNPSLQLAGPPSQSEKLNLCKRIINRLWNIPPRLPLPASLEELAQSERRHAEKMKIIYSQFIVNPSALRSAHLHTLKQYLYTPHLGDALVLWGNAHYGRTLTPSAAIERADLLLSARSKCPTSRLLCLVLLTLLAVRLLS